MNPEPGKRRPGWAQKASAPGEAGAGYDLAANILLGLGLGWVAQHYFPGMKPWGYVGGLLLGAASGFYQLFKRYGRPKKGA